MRSQSGGRDQSKIARRFDAPRGQLSSAQEIIFPTAPSHERVAVLVTAAVSLASYRLFAEVARPSLPDVTQISGQRSMGRVEEEKERSLPRLAAKAAVAPWAKISQALRLNFPSKTRPAVP